MLLTGQLLYKIGQVIQRSTVKSDVIKVRANKMKLNKYLLMYFQKKRDIWCTEEGNETKVGDVVLIKRSHKIPTENLVTHKVIKSIFPVGNIIDPVTDRRCRGTEYINVQEERKRRKKIASAARKLTERIEKQKELEAADSQKS